MDDSSARSGSTTSEPLSLEFVGRPHWFGVALRWLLYLFFRPRAFFEQLFRVAPRSTAWLALFVVGGQLAVESVNSGIDSYRWFLQQLSLKQSPWLDWLVFLAVALLLGKGYEGLAGFWFWLRARLAGSRAGTLRDAERAAMLSSIVAFLPTLATGIFAVAITAFGGTIPAWLGAAALMLLVFPALSCWTGFAAARAVFQIRVAPGLLWFGVVPLLVCAAGYFFFFRLAQAQNVLRPDVTNRKVFQSEWVTFEYPGNWSEAAQPTASAAARTVCVVFGSRASVSLAVDASDADLEQHRREIQSRFKLTDCRKTGEFSQWRAFPGQGIEFSGRSGNFDVTYLSFCCDLESGNVLMIDELIPRAAYSVLKPGFVLVRQSLALKQDRPREARR